jgi:hypothetical protein
VNTRIMRKTSTILLVCGFVLVLETTAVARRRPPAGGRVAVVVDERLSVLRATPELNGVLLRRIGRGGLVAVRGEKRSPDGVVFYLVNVTRRTRGWLQRDAVIVPSRAGDDDRLLRLIKGSEDFDRIARARIFLENFRQSELRPQVLMLYAEAAQEAAARLSRDASRRLSEKEMAAGGAPLLSYFLNFSGLDRYNRQGITFLFDAREKQFRYDGQSWQELIQRYPNSPEAVEGRKRLQALAAR